MNKIPQFETGELVNVTIRGARVTNTYPTVTNGRDTGVMLVADYAAGRERSIAVNLAERSVTVERVAPKEWPPQAGDIWEDRNRNEWSALVWDGEVRLYQVDNDGSTREWADSVANAVGPMRLVRRRGWTPTPPAAMDAEPEVDGRAATVAGLRAFAELLETRTDISPPANINGQLGFRGEPGLAEAAKVAANLGIELGEPYETGDKYQHWARCGEVQLGGGVTLTLYVHGLDAARFYSPIDDAEPAWYETPEDSATIVDANLRAMGGAGLDQPLTDADSQVLTSPAAMAGDSSHDEAVTG